MSPVLYFCKGICHCGFDLLYRKIVFTARRRKKELLRHEKQTTAGEPALRPWSVFLSAAHMLLRRLCLRKDLYSPSSLYPPLWLPLFPLGWPIPPETAPGAYPRRQKRGLRWSYSCLPGWRRSNGCQALRQRPLPHTPDSPQTAFVTFPSLSLINSFTVVWYTLGSEPNTAMASCWP